MHRVHARYVAATDPDGAVIRRHWDLIDRVARRLAARTAGAVAPDDLWSAGAMGLLEAARRFDAARDVRFETFAEHRIRGAMLDELRRMDHLPRRLRARAEELERTRARLAQSLQREPTAEDLCQAMGMDPEELSSLGALADPVRATLETLEAPHPSPDQHLERAERTAALAEAVTRLPDRLQQVLALHYVEGLTYREIARILSVSEPRVCQLHTEAIATLRAGWAHRGQPRG